MVSKLFFIRLSPVKVKALFPARAGILFLKTLKRHFCFLHIAKTKVLKKVWKKGVGFGAGKKALSSKGLFHRPDSSNLFYRPLSGTALKLKRFISGTGRKLHGIPANPLKSPSDLSANAAADNLFHCVFQPIHKNCNFFKYNTVFLKIQAEINFLFENGNDS